jgi:predicted component of type VI protein secretion system
MFITKAALHRRTFLKSAGATLALPFLDAMLPALTPAARAATRTPRVGFIYISNGTDMERWTPVTLGEDFEFSPILKPLEPHRQSALVVSGMGNKIGGANTHPGASAGWLTGVDAKMTEGDDVENGTSIDQVIAQKVGGDTLFPSLEIATEDFSSAIGSCAGGYSCIYENTISWSSPTTPVPMEINPRALFERLFGRAGSATQRAIRLKNESSILDSVRREVQSLQTSLGAADRRRFGDYLQNLREIEQRIQQTEKRNSTNVTIPDAPVGIPESHDEHLSLMFDLMAVAYQADLSRVFSFYTTRELSQMTYPTAGVTEPHHSVSHHTNDPEKLRSMMLIGRHYAQHVSRFVDKLKAMPEATGSVLDDSMICFGSGMSNSNIHSHIDLPLVVLGGHFKGNRHVRFEGQPLSNFWLTLADKAGARIESFGNGTTPVSL